MKTERLMSQHILLRIYKRIKRNPKKIFLLKDFGLASQSRRVYMTTLIKLNLIEEVDAFYEMGCKHSALKSVHGYKLRRRNGIKV